MSILRLIDIFLTFGQQQAAEENAEFTDLREPSKTYFS